MKLISYAHLLSLSTLSITYYFDPPSLTVEEEDSTVESSIDSSRSSSNVSDIEIPPTDDEDEGHLPTDDDHEQGKIFTQN
jgi:hypothetical protein